VIVLTPGAVDLEPTDRVPHLEAAASPAFSQPGCVGFDQMCD